jgi:predicted RNA binding protein YcfA (HicA-like mRNA interferase family)
VPSEIRYIEIRRLLESHGWKLDRVRGSHHVFSKPGEGSFPVPVHNGKVKAVYGKKLEKILRKGKEE